MLPTHPGAKEQLRFGPDWPPLFCRSTICLLAAVTGLLSLELARAEEPAKRAIQYPFMAITFASPGEIEKTSDFVFEAADRLDMQTRSRTFFEEGMFGFNGLDKSAPAGLYFFLGADLTSGPVSPLGFAGVSDVDKGNQWLSQLMSMRGPQTATIEDVPNKTGRFKIKLDQRVMHIRHQDGAVFTTEDQGSVSMFDAPIAPPAQLLKRQASNYLISQSFLLERVPIGMKTLGLGVITNGIEADLQQRDGENEELYASRRAAGERLVALIKLIAEEGKEGILGVGVDRVNKVGFAEADFRCEPNKQLSKLLGAASGRQSQFGPVLSQPAVLTGSLSLLLDEQTREPLAALSKQLWKQNSLETNETNRELIAPCVTALANTVGEGHLDGFIQLTTGTDKLFTAVAAIKINGGAAFPEQVTKLIKELENGALVKDRLAFDIEKIGESRIHSVQQLGMDKNGVRLFGENAKIYLAIAPNAIWLALGEESVALPQLKDSLGRMTRGAGQSTRRAAVQIETTLRGISRLIDPDNDKRSGEMLEELDAIPTTMGDAIRLDVVPRDNGIRLRVEAEEAIIALVGRLIARGVLGPQL